MCLFLHYIFILKAEEQSRKLRLEEDLLVDCTFTPKTKWRLAAEKRKRAKEALERLEEDDANQKIPTPSVSFHCPVYALSRTDMTNSVCISFHFRSANCEIVCLN